MSVLVAFGSKHGATEEIADAIAAVLRDRGLQVDVRAATKDTPVDGYDAFVIGSAVYAGHWLGEAHKLAERVAEVHGDRPVWLFSSGPIGDPPKPEPESVRVDDLLAATNAVEHMVFAGELDRSELNFAERLITKVVHAKDGDYRDWDAIRAWADTIADGLHVRAASTG